MSGSSLDRAIAALLRDDRAGDPVPDRETIDHVLTAGYAEALNLEAERLNAERRLLRLARSTGAADQEQAQQLRASIREIDERLPALRSGLAEIDVRFRSGWSAGEGHIERSG
jgi:hypothetical protein